MACLDCDETKEERIKIDNIKKKIREKKKNKIKKEEKKKEIKRTPILFIK